ncbi:DUF2513 domain-containing protein [Bradyrhizobium xenonodulans]|uniref:DUF2513 domain-containing protein n=1 Tax=Bradyrhizobium xenonodulans TaxID=2736875 RepID=A0ABY7MXU0_9BRAD|nr:DUF2513 domain-containing protein [Bradyrhizobium xenonodulans]WBL82287.1 DUF2513 domain-containing protein [Bradyrhizobium xenonodulans]
MRRDRELIHRILLAIEAKTSTRPEPIEMAGEDPQKVLDHLALLFDEGLIQTGPRPHRSSSTGLIDQVLVRDLTPAGRDWLEAEARQAGHPPFIATAYESDVTQAPGDERHPGHLQGVGARGVAGGEGLATATGQVGPTGSAESPAAPLGPNGTTGPRRIGLLDEEPILQRPLEATARYQAQAVEFSAGGEDRPEVLHRSLIARVAVLEAIVEELRRPAGIGIGHNQPPPDAHVFAPVTADDLDEIDHLIVLLKEQPPAPTTVSPQLIEQSRVVSKIGTKIAELADIYAKEVVKSAGQETGKRLVQLPFWLGVSSAIAGVASALQIWISALPH